jgi:hypothetical protein
MILEQRAFGFEPLNAAIGRHTHMMERPFSKLV